MLLGKYSYGLYVFHGIVAYWMHQHALEARWTPWLASHLAASVMVTVVGFAGSFVIAYASFELYERPMLKLKRFFEYKSQASSAA
jgi:peptidoglycan/LPS O-acetylase OafA/YrhL